MIVFYFYLKRITIFFYSVMIIRSLNVSDDDSREFDICFDFLARELEWTIVI